MSEQKFYVPGDSPVQESYQKEFEKEREQLKAAFQMIWEDMSEIVSYSATATLEPKSFLVKVDASAGAVTLTLPKPADIPLGKKYLFKKLDAINDLILQPAAGQIEGAANYTIAAAAGKKAVMFMSDGVDYHLVAQG